MNVIRTYIEVVEGVEEIDRKEYLVLVLENGTERRIALRS